MERIYREATAADVPRMRDIYAYYVENTTVSFEYTAPDTAEFFRRFAAVTADFPWLVCEENGQVIGYAYASRTFQRQAYAWDASSSLYIAADRRRAGIGRELCTRLEDALRAMGYHQLYAVITGENDASCRFHEACGYTVTARFAHTGYKTGRWLDVFWYEKVLLPPQEPNPVRRYAELSSTPWLHNA